MSLPFTPGEFFGAFRAYHAAIGLAPLVLIGLAVAALVLAYSKQAWRHEAIACVLATFWLWSGVVYHWGFFAAINPAARLFGALFISQGIVLIVMGVIRRRWQFAPRAMPTAGIGWLLIVYALVLYPLLGWWFGHGYPDGPSFGAPCPTTIFFLGMTLWMARGVPILAVIIPLAWTLVGTSAAVGLRVYEDFALSASAVLVLAALVRRRATSRLTPRPEAT